jgi:hypothetical protein
VFLAVHNYLLIWCPCFIVGPSTAQSLYHPLSVLGRHRAYSPQPTERPCPRQSCAHRLPTPPHAHVHAHSHAHARARTRPPLSVLVTGVLTLLCILSHRAVRRASRHSFPNAQAQSKSAPFFSSPRVSLPIRPCLLRRGSRRAFPVSTLLECNSSSVPPVATKRVSLGFASVPSPSSRAVWRGFLRSTLQCAPLILPPPVTSSGHS